MVQDFSGNENSGLEYYILRGSSDARILLGDVVRARGLLSLAQFVLSNNFLYRPRFSFQAEINGRSGIRT